MCALACACRFVIFGHMCVNSEQFHGASKTDILIFAVHLYFVYVVFALDQLDWIWFLVCARGVFEFTISHCC